MCYVFYGVNSCVCGMGDDDRYTLCGMRWKFFRFFIFILFERVLGLKILALVCFFLFVHTCRLFDCCVLFWHTQNGSNVNQTGWNRAEHLVRSKYTYMHHRGKWQANKIGSVVGIYHQNQDTFHVINVDIRTEHVNVQIWNVYVFFGTFICVRIFRFHYVSPFMLEARQKK